MLLGTYSPTLFLVKISPHFWLIYAVILEFEFLFQVLGIVGIPKQLVHALSKISGTLPDEVTEFQNSSRF